MSHVSTVYEKYCLHVVWNTPKCRVFVEWVHIVYLYISFAKGWWNDFELPRHNVLYISVYLQVKLQCYRLLYWKAFAIFFSFTTLKTSTDPDIYTSWFLASSLQDSDNTISVFFAVEKQTGLWTDHYINSFLKGGSYFKKGWRNAKRDLNFNLNLFQQVKGSFERGFQQRWWYLKVINKHLNLQWKTVILLLSSVGEELGLLWSHPKNKNK